MDPFSFFAQAASFQPFFSTLQPSHYHLLNVDLSPSIGHRCSGNRHRRGTSGLGAQCALLSSIWILDAYADGIVSMLWHNVKVFSSFTSVKRINPPLHRGVPRKIQIQTVVLRKIQMVVSCKPRTVRVAQGREISGFYSGYFCSFFFGERFIPVSGFIPPSTWNKMLGSTVLSWSH
jgi:hypothetical protein